MRVKVGGSKVKKYEKRMVNEYRKLCKKIKKLEAFIIKHEEDYGFISDDHYRLMMTQYHAMCAYEGALRARIEDHKIKLK